MNGNGANGDVSNNTGSLASKSASSTVQNLLAENAQLIEMIAGFQRIRKYADVPKYMELLYKNISHLAKLGDPEALTQIQLESGLVGASGCQQQPPQQTAQPPTPATTQQPPHPAQTTVMMPNGQTTQQRLIPSTAPNPQYMTTTTSQVPSTQLMMPNGAAMPQPMQQPSMPPSTQVAGQPHYPVAGMPPHQLPPPPMQPHPSQFPPPHQPQLPMQHLPTTGVPQHDPAAAAAAAAMFHQHHPQAPHPYAFPPQGMIPGTGQPGMPMANNPETTISST